MFLGFALDMRLASDDVADPNKTHPDIAFNMLGSLVLFVDALVCFVDWHLQRTRGALTVLNSSVEIINKDLLLVSELSETLSNCYFINNTFFLAAAIIYMIQGEYAEIIPTTKLVK